MTSNTRVPKAEITGIYGALLKTISKKMFGEVPDAARRDVAQPAGAQGQLWGSAARPRSGTSATRT